MVFVSGKVEKEELFQSIQHVEDDERKKQREPFQHPNEKSCPSFNGTIDKTIQYPEG